MNLLNTQIGVLAPPGWRLRAFALDVGSPTLAVLLAVLPIGLGIIQMAFGVILLFVYAIWTLRLLAQGTTFGKRLLNMYVVQESGATAGFGTMLLRDCIGKAISGIPFLLGYLWILFDAHNQSWHNKLASTYVVRRPQHNLD